MSQKHDEVENELLASERTYYGRLEVLYECLLDPIVKFIEAESKRPLGHSKVTSDEVNQVFQVVIQIKDFTNQLLTALEVANQNGEALGPVFVRLAPFFRLYSTYYEHFSKAQDQLAALVST